MASASADPVVVRQIVQAAHQTGADPAALLATALQESGARFGAVGDVASGHPSYGPFQMRSQVGALGEHSPAWANSYPAVLNRAQAFAADQVHGGKGAAAVQRPANASAYAQGVQSKLSIARQLLGQSAPASAGGTNPAAATLPSAAGSPLGSLGPMDRLKFVDAILGNAPLSTIAGLVQKSGATTAPPATSLPSPQSPGAGAPITSSPRGIYTQPNFAGADQGVDFRGQGAVTALADAVVTRVENQSSWIGAGGKGTGAIVSYRITQGPYAGRNVYVAENLTPHVKVGQHVRAGEPIATAHGAFPYTESGWADANGSPIGALGTSSTGKDFANAWSIA